VKPLTSGALLRFAAVSRYDWLLFLHLIGAFAMMGSVVAFSSLLVGGERVAGPQLVFLGRRLFEVGGLLTLVFGIWLALDDYSITDGWILAALVLWVIGGGSGSRVGELYNSGAAARARQPLAVMTIATLAILFVMIFKPGA
jgi:uncharacterized membrane protein